MSSSLTPKPVMAMASIHTGDLLAWGSNPYSTFSDLCLKAIGKLTNSEFGHVGIAWRCHDGMDDELFIIEATIPKIRIARLTTDREFYCVPMNVEWTTRSKSFLVSKIDYPYGILDAIRGGLGLRAKHDMKWQCAELAHEFYELCGIRLRPDYTPGKLIQNCIEVRRSNIYRVVGPGRTISETY